MSNTISSTKLLMKTFVEPNDITILPQHHLQTRQTNLIPAICFYNGSFVPIHGGHINLLEETKNYINNLGTHEFLGAYISPSHSGYISKKLNSEELVGAGHRLSMIYIAIEHIQWIMVDLFEIFQPYNTKLNITMKYFISRVHSQLPYGKEIDIFWLRGEDALTHKISPDNIIELGFNTIYIMNRASNENLINEYKSIEDYHDTRWEEIRSLSSFPEKFHIIKTKYMNLSSSSIRACAQNTTMTREQLQSCVQIDKVTNYIIEHQLWNTGRDILSRRMSSLSIFPDDINDLTSELLSYMLSIYSGSSIKVQSFLFERIGVGTGWNGSIYRLYDIEYSSDNINSLPRSIILKLSTGIWLQRVASIEPEFYFKCSPCISNIEIPKCYYADRHPECPNKSLLLLEDLSLNYYPLGEKESIEDSTIFLLINSIACLHAEFCNHPLLKKDLFNWLPTLNSTVEHYHHEYLLKINDKDFMQLLESRVSSKAYIYAKSLVTNISNIFQRLTDQYYTLSHGDFWINNIYMRRNQSYRLVIFDWQTCCRANGLIDVVFLLRLFDIDRARLLEPRILELYHEVLLKYGVLNYDLSSIRHDYYTLALPFMFVLLSSLKPLKDSKFNKIIMILEDIVTYQNNID